MLNLKAMNALRNKVQLIGHVGGNPEMRTFAEGKKWAKVRLATTEIYKNEKGEKVDETYWHSLVAWGRQAEIMERYVTKGKEIAVQGKLTNRAYEDKNGEKRYFTEVVVSEVLLMGK